MKKIVFLPILILLIFLLQFFTSEQTQTANTTAVVERVIDGDTIELQDGERVRLLEINTPEKGEKCFSESTNRLKELIEEKNVILEKDVSDRDGYGRLLRYVYLDQEFINLKLVREGLAHSEIIEPNIKHANQILEAEDIAREEKGCLWT